MEAYLIAQLVLVIPLFGPSIEWFLPGCGLRFRGRRRGGLRSGGREFGGWAIFEQKSNCPIPLVERELQSLAIHFQARVVAQLAGPNVKRVQSRLAVDGIGHQIGNSLNFFPNSSRD